ncbi:MAG: DUF2177 family protein [Rickettsiaceae bacterium]|nr:DUF2177 family protein [Rickettsiaceae bacterium]
MKHFLVLWLFLFAAIIVIDLIWLSFSVPLFYKPNLGHIIEGEFNYKIALLFYFIYAFSVCYLIVFPGVVLKASRVQIFVNGFIFGFTAYAAYDLTNQATIKDWPMIVSIVDILWGASLTGIVSVIGYIVLKAFK